jgi:hypothetical protein
MEFPKAQELLDERVEMWMGSIRTIGDVRTWIDGH